MTGWAHDPETCPECRAHRAIAAAKAAADLELRQYVERALATPQARRMVERQRAEERAAARFDVAAVAVLFLALSIAVVALAAAVVIAA